jgi:hypothetical protein
MVSSFFHTVRKSSVSDNFSVCAESPTETAEVNDSNALLSDFIEFVPVFRVSCPSARRRPTTSERVAGAAIISGSFVVLLVALLEIL